MAYDHAVEEAENSMVYFLSLDIYFLIFNDLDLYLPIIILLKDYNNYFLYLFLIIIL